MSNNTKPQGVLVIVADPTGRITASVSDFTLGGSAGFRQREMQERRAVNQVWRKVIDSRCDAEIAAAIFATSLEGRNIREQLKISNWTQTVITIGYEEYKINE